MPGRSAIFDFQNFRLYFGGLKKSFFCDFKKRLEKKNEIEKTSFVVA